LFQYPLKSVWVAASTLLILGFELQALTSAKAATQKSKHIRHFIDILRPLSSSIIMRGLL
jgi:hypothetical protein